MILSDDHIQKLCTNGSMIEPFVNHIERGCVEDPKLSYGLSSYGYDIRLSGGAFYTYKVLPGKVVDPKLFNPRHLQREILHRDENGEYFILPAHTYALGYAHEKLVIPDNITVICIGKSTYARCGIVVNTTPAEAGWEGYLTLEIANSSDAACRIYANEGIAQLLFVKGEPCLTSYQDRNGKYQYQKAEVTFAKV